MKKILYSALALAVMGLVSCSGDDNNGPQTKRGMTLKASIENVSTRATMTDNDGSWNFVFTKNDVVNVSNNNISAYYTFTNDGDQFSSADAMTTTEAADWYAYYPGNEVDLTSQDGSFDGVAAKYAVAGKTAKETTGDKGLTITLGAKVAVLRIVEVDKTGTLDINVKTADGKWVKGLTATKNAANFTVSTSNAKTTLLSKTAKAAEINYVVVPAGEKISVYNGDLLLNSTKDAGLTAGKYYTITSGPTKGTVNALIKGVKTPVDWVQLWAGGPRFATKNVAEELTWTEAAKTGSDFAWGENWRTPTADEITEEGGLRYDIYSQKAYEGSPSVALFQENGDYVIKFTGVQPGYSKNTLTLYNKIISGYDNFDFWTSTDYNGYGGRFMITVSDTYIGAFGISKRDNKNTTYWVRPVLAKSLSELLTTK